MDAFQFGNLIVVNVFVNRLKNVCNRSNQLHCMLYKEMTWNIFCKCFNMQKKICKSQIPRLAKQHFDIILNIRKKRWYR